MTSLMQKIDDYNRSCRFSALASGVWKSGNADSSRLPGPEETDIGEVHWSRRGQLDLAVSNWQGRFRVL